ncbi:MAG: hypothetical protein HKP41_01170 [Desulfobacterales bacterium]|nr:hypothetical protein [Desulfobacterales bacterium]
MDTRDGVGDIVVKFLDIPKLIASTEKAIQPTRYPNFDIVQSNRSLG